MFTGLVETTGTVIAATAAPAQQAEHASPPRLLRIQCPWPEMHAKVQIGDSIAVDGCCLTVVAMDGDILDFEAATETLRRTTLGTLGPDDRVHLERALRFGDRLDGHLVTGHIDGIGRIEQRFQDQSALYLGIRAPDAIADLIAAQGSITVQGVSLTVTRVDGPCFFVGLIPHTLAVTTLGQRQVGQALNLEADVLARYVKRLLAGHKVPQQHEKMA